MDIGDFSKIYKLEEKLFIVPTRTIGLLLINNLARRGGNILNINPITIRRLSLDICERYLEENDIIFLDDMLGESLVLDAMETLKDEEDFFFKKDLINLNTAKEVYKVLMELKSNKIKNFPKEKDLDRIYKEYTLSLKKLNAMDYPDLLVKAMDLYGATRFKDKTIGIAENIEFHNLEKDLFSLLSKNAVKIKMPVKQLSNSPKEYFFKENKAYGDLNKKIDFFDAYGRRNEITYIIEDILDKGLALDEVVISYTDKKYVEELNLEFANAGLPISFADGLDILSSTSYRFIKSVFSFVKNYYNIGELKPIFFDRTLKTNQENPASIYHELVKSGVVYGRDNYKKLKLIDQSLDKASVKKREWLKDFFMDILLAFPEETLTLKESIRRLVVLIKKYVRLPEDLDGKSYDEICMKSIVETLKTIEKLPLELSREEYFDIVLSYIEEINIERKGAGPGKVFACKYTTAPYSGRKHLYLIGLDSDSLDSKIVESPILLDKARRDISENLSFSSESYRYKKYKIRESLTADFETISIGYSNFDMVEIKAKTPSNIYTELEEECERPISFKAKEKSLMARDMVYSGTSLETLGQCPRKLYLSAKLDLKEKDDIELDFDKWLDPMTRGTLIHRVLNSYFDLPKPDRKEQALMDIVNKEVDLAKDQSPYILKEVYNKEKNQIITYCRDLIEREKRDNFEVLVNELSFGRDKTNLVFGSLKAQRIEIGGLNLKVRGAIDRVDIDRGRKKLRIIDYKTGGLKNFEERLRKAEGSGANKTYDYSESQKFQFFIYKKALENIIKTLEDFKDFTVESFCYEFKDKTLDLKFTDELLRPIEERIKSLLTIDIYLNDKDISYDEEDRLRCKYCEFKNICRGESLSIKEGEDY